MNQVSAFGDVPGRCSYTSLAKHIRMGDSYRGSQRVNVLCLLLSKVKSLFLLPHPTLDAKLHLIGTTPPHDKVCSFWSAIFRSRPSWKVLKFSSTC